MEDIIWQYIQKNFIKGDNSTLDQNTFTFGAAGPDSLSHVKLILFLERKFKITFDIENIPREKFGGLKEIVKLVKDKQSNR